jgi:hypothetical protein
LVTSDFGQHDRVNGLSHRSTYEAQKRWQKAEATGWHGLKVGAYSSTTGISFGYFTV